MRIVTKGICYVIAGHSSTHKQAKLPAGVVLNVIGGTGKAYELHQGHTLAICEEYDPERKRDPANYPNFWILKVDVEDFVYPEPPPGPGPVPEEDADGCLSRILKLFTK